MKWMLAIGLSVVLPFVGIPILFYMLWKNEDDRQWRRFKKGVSRRIKGPDRSDYHSDEAYRNEVDLEVDRLEELWRSRELFKSMQVEKVSGGNSLIIDGNFWTIEKYTDVCKDVLLRAPISELIEEWRTVIEEYLEFQIGEKQRLHTEAEGLRQKILSDLDKHVGWKEIVDKYAKHSFDVSIENGEWRISYERSLITLTDVSFAITQRPNQINFEREVGESDID